MNWNVVSAIFNRNLVSYFSTPTGYVFICLFVLLSSFAAFWPDDFFNANLANLEQLNLYMPWILLVFIPAITMSIWTEERRQGTDELLLTIPAGDLDVVMGKFLAATGIYAVSLLFSLFCSFSVLYLLSDGYMDYGLFFTNYLGYLLLGVAMLSIGMVASFLSNNLTVSFILGALFNAPFVIAQWANSFNTDETTAKLIKSFSFANHFHDFGRGVVSLPGMVYFLGITVLGLYLCMVLIGRRHWSGGRDGQSLWWHYLLRFGGLAAAVAGINLFFTGHSLGRFDASDKQLNSLSASTLAILRDLPGDKPVLVEAFVSPVLPEAYQQQRLSLENFLREIEQRSDRKVSTRIITVEPDTEEAARAEDTYDIRPVLQEIRERGKIKEEEIFLGMAFTCGPRKLVKPFFDKDLPLEYELIHSISAVTQPEKKRIGIVKTQAEVLGPSQPERGPQRGTGFELFVNELKKQYEVISVDPTQPIELKLDGEPKFAALIAIQPSTLTQPQMDNLAAAIKAGQKTLVFEDPFPFYFGRSLQSTHPGMVTADQPIETLWQTLGVRLENAPPGWVEAKEKRLKEQEFNLLPQDEPDPFQLRERRKQDPLLDGTFIVWSDYLPEKRLVNQIYRQMLFVSSQDQTANNPFNPASPVTAGLDKVFLPFVGSLVKDQEGTTNMQYLVRTSEAGGYITAGDAREALQQQLRRAGSGLSRFEVPRPGAFVVAAMIRGNQSQSGAAILPMEDSDSPERARRDSPERARRAIRLAQATPANGSAPAADSAGKSADAVPPAPPMSPTASTPEPNPGNAVAAQNAAALDKLTNSATATAAPLHVIVVTDVDLLHNLFFATRENNEVFPGIDLQLDNVTLALNMVDNLAGDDRFVDVRKRTLKPNTLRTIEEQNRANADEMKAATEAAKESFENTKNQIRNEIRGKVDGITAAKKQLRALLDNNQIDPTAYQDKLNALDEQLEYVDRIESNAAQTTFKQLESQYNREIGDLQRKSLQQLEGIQNKYKAMAIILPPIFPLVVAFFVYFRRKAQEQEGVSRNRLR
ncbi:MAG: Gldg family protein [Pirellulales bacterium]|nr:Gldg family protein [Pirellulales bacterium]